MLDLHQISYLSLNSHYYVSLLPTSHTHHHNHHHFLRGIALGLWEASDSVDCSIDDVELYRAKKKRKRYCTLRAQRKKYKIEKSVQVFLVWGSGYSSNFLPLLVAVTIAVVEVSNHGVVWQCDLVFVEEDLSIKTDRHLCALIHSLWYSP